MSIRTTLTLDDDLVARLKEESKQRGISFRKMLNEALRVGLHSLKTKPSNPKFKIKAFDLGVYPGLNYDNIGALLEIAEGETWR